MFVDLSDIPLMIYTFQADMVYAQTPQWLENGLVDGKAMPSKNKHANWYKCYLKRETSIATAFSDQDLSFVEFCRKYHYDDNAKKVHPRVYGKAKHWYKRGAAVGIRFIYELRDQFIGQYFTMFASHNEGNAMELTTKPGEMPEGTRYLAAAIESGLKPGGVVNGYVGKCVATEGSSYDQFSPLIDAEWVTANAMQARKLLVVFILHDICQDDIHTHICIRTDI